MKKTYVAAFMAIVLACFAVANCGKKETTAAAASEVAIASSAFVASSVTVSKGTSVKWTNSDSIAHTVTSDTTIWDSGSIAAGGTFTRVFDTAGTFPYHCNIHTTMTATVIVQ